ncbi:TlpA family protein disulfide reductase [Rhodococcus sp. WMMA185]|uniref:TlpA family protein disulfide reductase n=1 Tax=Rhodococcus sp. WMMA185 TaxID=679318 RepID=UPI000878D95E|nr:TlpA disulfide reductase family protein [Rhodococcus sp. WMMA185]
MSASARWSLAALVVVVALVVAIWPRGGDAEVATYDGRFGSGRITSNSEGTDPDALAALRSQASLAPCPAPTGAPDPSSDSPLSGITLDCMGDGSQVDLAAALAGKPALLNLWAYWCGPCAEELPYLQRYSERAGDAITVLTVHSDPNESSALSRLTDYAVTLPGVQDGDGRVRAAVGAPAVLPVSVLIRSDGTVAKILPQPFDSVDDIAAAVEQSLGVAA